MPAAKGKILKNLALLFEFSRGFLKRYRLIMPRHVLFLFNKHFRKSYISSNTKLRLFYSAKIIIAPYNLSLNNYTFWINENRTLNLTPISIIVLSVCCFTKIYSWFNFTTQIFKLYNSSKIIFQLL